METDFVGSWFKALAATEMAISFSSKILFFGASTHLLRSSLLSVDYLRVI
jgi:hypothetical protein